MRSFYTDLLQLDEVFFDENTSLAYKCDKLQFTIFQVQHNLPEIKGWGIQPGWSGGMHPSTSWSVECGKDTFSPAVKRLQQAGVMSYYYEPQWFGYWSYPVRDPVGNTVEITCPHGNEVDGWSLSLPES